jgi:hypothetical protein
MSEYERYMREAASWHEAGHFVTALTLGLHPEWCKLDGVNGSTRVNHTCETELENLHWLCVLLSGNLAERIHYKRRAPAEDGHKHDNDQADKILTQWQDHESRLVAQRNATREAARILHKRWSDVQFISGELRAKGYYSLTGKKP